MTEPDTRPSARRSDADEGVAGDSSPSMLDLVRLSPRLIFPPGGAELYRQIALLTDLSEGDEVLVAGCGNGVTVEHFVTEYDVHGSGVDTDAHLVAAAEERARARGLVDSLHFQTGAGDRLPYRDAIFDVAVGELGLTSRATDPAAAVRELVRVTRPGGSVVLVQLVWKAPVDETRRRLLTRHLGVQPLMLVEWKRILREAGVEHLHTEDWSDDETAFRSRGVKPFPDFAELFSFGEKIGILRRAWARWGWRGVKAAVAREREVHQLLTRERILGLDLVKGVKSPGQPGDTGHPPSREGDAVRPAERADTAAPSAAAPPPEPSHPQPEPGPEPEPDDHEETEGLPLFTSPDDNG